MNPRLCSAGITLRLQINQRFPNRSRRSDGWIGDARHRKKGSASQHNPDENGWVRAIDIDENMGRGRDRNGATAKELADQLVAYAGSSLPGADRILYVVYENQLASGTYRRWFWKWRGKGYGHTAHIHVSFTKAGDRNGDLFPLPILTTDPDERKEWAAALGL
jgi:hypothetical protein